MTAARHARAAPRILSVLHLTTQGVFRRTELPLGACKRAPVRAFGVCAGRCEIQAATRQLRH